MDDRQRCLTGVELHSAIGEWARNKVADYFLVTDGSGYDDGFGAYAGAFMCPADGGKFRKVFTCGSDATTVERSELEALIKGLQLIADDLGLDRISKFEVYRSRKVVVQWVTDRESLVGCVWSPDGLTSHWQRRSTPDLWSWYTFFEPYFEVIPVFMQRQTVSAHDVVDRLASELRLVLREWSSSKDELGMKALPQYSGQ